MAVDESLRIVQGLISGMGINCGPQDGIIGDLTRGGFETLTERAGESRAQLGEYLKQ